MSIQTENPQKAAVKAGVQTAYEAEGYITPSGVKDTTAVRERIFEVVRPHKVLAYRDREGLAITRGEVTKEVFPGLLGPDQFDDADDPQLAQAIWIKIDSAVWTQLQANANGPVQRLVGINMGNGYVLCRTQIGVNSTDAVYITDNRQCIERDYLSRDNKALQAKIDLIAANREMLILRQPDNAAVYARGLDRLLKALESASHDRLALAIEAATADDSDDADGSGDGSDDADGSGGESGSDQE